MITLAWWQVVGGLLLAWMAGGACVALLLDWVDDPKRTPVVDDGSWEDNDEDY